jgi:hypothetical protein
VGATALARRNNKGNNGDDNGDIPFYVKTFILDDLDLFINR